MVIFVASLDSFMEYDGIAGDFVFLVLLFETSLQHFIFMKELLV